LRTKRRAELLLLAAAEPLGEPLLVWHAAGKLGINREAVNAVTAGRKS
jgi:hypothetical protein